MCSLSSRCVLRRHLAKGLLLAVAAPRGAPFQRGSGGEVPNTSFSGHHPSIARRNVYEGQWKAGVPEGKGTYRFAHGNEYEGEYKAGKREGKGTL